MFTKNRFFVFIRVPLVVVVVMGWFGVIPTQAAPSVEFNWATRMGSTNVDQGTAIVVDGNGNVYTTGFFYGTVDFDPGAGIYNLTSAGLADIFISKLDGSGNFVWAKRLGGPDDDEGADIVVDESENVYTTGLFSGTADFDPGPGISNQISLGKRDIFISKLDGNGNFVWAKGIGGSIDDDTGNSITVDGTGNVYITGVFNGTVDFDTGSGTYNLTSAGSWDVFISKLNGSGNIIWVKRIGGSSSDYSTAIGLDGSGNVHITGFFSAQLILIPARG